MMITTSHLNDHNDSHEYHSSNSSINDNRSSSSTARCLEPLVWFFFSPLFPFI